jgi:hypothetical protein
MSDFFQNGGEFPAKLFEGKNGRGWNTKSCHSDHDDHTFENIPVHPQGC